MAVGPDNHIYEPVLSRICRIVCPFCMEEVENARVPEDHPKRGRWENQHHKDCSVRKISNGEIIDATTSEAANPEGSSGEGTG